MQDDAGMVKTSKFKDTVNQDDYGMFSRMMSRMTIKKNTNKNESDDQPALQDDGGSC